VVWRAEIYRTVPLLWYHLARLGLSDRVPEHIAGYLDHWTLLSAVRSRLVFTQLGRICEAFAASDVPFFLLKGTAIAPLCYPDPFVRPMLDMDIMIPPASVGRARQVMESLGYSHSLWDAATDQMTLVPDHLLAEYQTNHYELPGYMTRVRAGLPRAIARLPQTWGRKHLKCFIYPNQVVSFALFVDLHVNLSVGFDLDDIWRGTRREMIFGRSVPVQSPTSMVWFLASRLYHEAFEFNTLKLTMFGDLQAVLRRWQDTIDWDELVTMVDKYGMQASNYYVLAQLQRLASACVPDSVLERIRPDRRALPSARDWGDVMPKLLSRTALIPFDYAGDAN
jgi:hypothetical protein